MAEELSMQILEKNIGYVFKNRSLLQTALSHSSYVNESKKTLKNNERLEFLGDSVLSVIVSDYIFHHCDMAEGDLTKLRASLVCEQSLFDFAREIDLGEFIKLGHGEEMTGGRTRPSILSDAFEALIAAIYLDGGIEPASEFVLGFIKKAADGRQMHPAFNDYKTQLQEIIQQNPEEKVIYRLVEESGPDHNKQFIVEVMLNSNVIGRGVGKSKKNAEQQAAKEALSLMGF